MALGRIIKSDVRRSLSSYFSAPAIVAFVALCLVGLWMIMASSSVPLQEFSHEENLAEKPLIEGTGTEQIVDNARNSPEYLVPDAHQDLSNPDVQKSETPPDASSENADQEVHETKSGENEDKGNVSNGISKPETGNEAGKSKGGNFITAEAPEKDSSPNSENIQGDPGATGQVESDDSSIERHHTDKAEGLAEAKVIGDQEKNSESPSVNETNDQPKDQVSNEPSPGGVESEILNETITQNRAWTTQAVESRNENNEQQSTGIKKISADGYSWKVCNVTAGPDYIPCLDNVKAIHALRTTKHYEHRERHCPEEGPTCLVSLPKGYRKSIDWPQSRDKVYLLSGWSSSEK